MDFSIEIPSSQRDTVILVVIDLLTKMGHFVALPKLPSASELAHIFLQKQIGVDLVLGRMLPPLELKSSSGAWASRQPDLHPLHLDVAGGQGGSWRRLLRLFQDPGFLSDQWMVGPMERGWG